MKRKMSIVVALCLSFMFALCLFACGKTGGGMGKIENCLLVENGETRVVISVGDIGGNATLLDCMEHLSKLYEDFTFTMKSGMVTSINGVENTEDFSSCWMVYTSDAEMANAAWGTIDYNGATLGSAVVGADALTVITGEIYVWEYVGF